MTDRQVNPKKAVDRMCPRCGEMLEFLYRTDQRGREVRYEARKIVPRRYAPDDEEIPKVKQVSKYESIVVGVQYVHIEKYECRWCRGRWSEGQAVPHEFEYEELPDDFYFREVDLERVHADFEAAMRGEYKRPRFLHEIEPRPHQLQMT